MRKILLIMLWAAVQPLSAQTECFTYADGEQTIVNGVSPEGIAHILDEEELTLPAHIVKVASDAFATVKAYYLSGARLSTLIIDSGNPEFELSAENKNALADVNSTLSTIEIQGGAMSTDNLGSLLTGLDNTGTLTKIDIYDDSFPLDATFTQTAIKANTAGVKVVLPAARVGTQTFGNATVYGRFMLTSEIVTFCGNQLFYDKDDGSQFLFYIPTGTQEESDEKKIRIQRVRYVLPGEGVLLHKTEGSSSKVELPRTDEDDIETQTQYDTDQALFRQNMLVGVTVPTAISATEEKNGTKYTNMILYNGLFYRTSGGTLNANRAYLQVRDEELAGMAKLSMLVANAEEGNATAVLSPFNGRNAPAPLYDLQGRKVLDNSTAATAGQALPPGIYISQGRKTLITGPTRRR